MHPKSGHALAHMCPAQRNKSESHLSRRLRLLNERSGQVDEPYQ